MICLTLRTSKFIPPPWFKKRGGGRVVYVTPSGVFDMLQYFETILPLVESQDEVYFVGGGTAQGL